MIADKIFSLLTTTVLLALVNNALVEIFHHSKLFKNIRNFLMFLCIKLKRHNFWLKSYRCPFCLSYQFAIVISIPFFSGIDILLFLAVARLSNLINDYSYPYLRTPR